MRLAALMVVWLLGCATSAGRSQPSQPDEATLLTRAAESSPLEARPLLEQCTQRFPSAAECWRRLAVLCARGARDALCARDAYERYVQLSDPDAGGSGPASTDWNWNVVNDNP